MKELGRHVLVEMYDCDPVILDDLEKIRQEMLEAAVVAGSTIVGQCFHRFSPQGVSGVVVIAESHFSIHTWPEYGYAAVDLFTCGQKVDPWKALDRLSRVFCAGKISPIEVKRGLFPAELGFGHKPPDY